MTRVANLGMGVALAVGRALRPAPAIPPPTLGKVVESPCILGLFFRVGARREGCGTRERPHRLVDGHCDCGTIVSPKLIKRASSRGAVLLDVTPLDDRRVLGAVDFAEVKT